MADIQGGKSAATLAESVWLVLASRLISVVGVPVAGFIFYLVWNGLTEMTNEVRLMRTQIAVLTERVDTLREAKGALEQRIKELERRPPPQQ